MWKKVVALVVVSVLSTLSFMTLFKVIMDGSVQPRCYLMAMEFCNQDCWVGRPFDAFPLDCSDFSGVGIGVIATVISAFASLCITLCLVACVVKVLLQRRNAANEQGSYQQM